MKPTIQIKGKTLFLAVHNGTVYGYMRPSALREFHARMAAK